MRARCTPLACTEPRGRRSVEAAATRFPELFDDAVDPEVAHSPRPPPPPRCSPKPPVPQGKARQSYAAALSEVMGSMKDEFAAILEDFGVAKGLEALDRAAKKMMRCKPDRRFKGADDAAVAVRAAVAAEKRAEIEHLTSTLQKVPCTAAVQPMPRLMRRSSRGRTPSWRRRSALPPAGARASTQGRWSWPRCGARPLAAGFGRGR